MELEVAATGRHVRPNNIICLARTYRKHAEELGNEVPPAPIIFLKPNSSLVPDGTDIVIPPDCGEVHHEVELAVVIGKGGRWIPADSAMDHVLGYGVILDITARDIQSVLKEKGLPWTYAKGWDTFAPISAIAPRDLVGDPGDLGIKLLVNGTVKQDSRTKFMLFTVADILAYISGFMTLQEGDVIATGTPEGVGPLASGDQVYAEIERVGKLSHKVVK